MNEETIKKLEELLEQVSKLPGSNFKICKSNLDEMIHSYMHLPLIVVEGSRLGTNIKTLGPYSDIKDVSIHCIGTILNLFPESERNKILYEAIQIPTSKEGELFEDEEEDGEE